MKSSILWSRIVSELRVTTSYEHRLAFLSLKNEVQKQNDCEQDYTRCKSVDVVEEKCKNLHVGHDLFNVLGVQLQDTIQDTNFVVPKRFLPVPMELEGAR